jgi:hypothetical protein
VVFAGDAREGVSTVPQPGRSQHVCLSMVQYVAAVCLARSTRTSTSAERIRPAMRTPLRGPALRMHR